MDAKSPDPSLGWMTAGDAEPPSVDESWNPVDIPEINGVAVKEVRPVLVGSGSLTEVWRHEWSLDPHKVEQVFQRLLDAGGVSGWHAHVRTTDRLFCSMGRVRLSLYDGRTSSPTFGAVWQRVFGEHRPLLVVVPPGVWHGLKALGPSPALVLNVTDRAYHYDEPDQRRLPPDTPHIPIKLV